MKSVFHRARVRAFTLLAATAAAAMVWSAPANAGAALSYRVLHDFCKNAPCADGSFPAGDRLVMDATGNFFGTTANGGRYEAGAIYEVFPKHGGAKYFKKVLRAFCYGPCGSGGHSQSGVIMDTAGNLYGTTPANGLSACGVVYEAVLGGGKYTLNALHTFGTKGDGCNPTIGALAYQGMDQGMPYDGTSPLYGVTNAGGANGHGAVFQVSPPAPGGRAWQESVVYSYCELSLCADGGDPIGNVVMDSSGNLYTTAADGTGNSIFELLDEGGSGFLKQNVWHTLSAEVYGLLRITPDGTLYGVAGSGGPTVHGTLFKVTPDGSGGFNYTDLHDFCPGGAGTCTDGDMPDTLLIDSSGNIWGTTIAGGLNAAPAGSPFTGAGVIFEYTNGGIYSTAHHFCALANCTDGGTPAQGLVTDGAGHFFGTTALGGETGSSAAGKAPIAATAGGVLYELSAF